MCKIYVSFYLHIDNENRMYIKLYLIFDNIAFNCQ